jgi:hypothetical protein
LLGIRVSYQQESSIKHHKEMGNSVSSRSNLDS